MFAATTWALKRLLKFVLKRNLKQWIATEIDLDQVEVQLGQGSLELREVLLNVDYINQQLDHTHWEVVTAFVGCIRAYIPLASLYQDSCSIQLVDVFLTVQPRAQPGPASHAPGAAPGTPRPPPPAPTDGVSDGIRIIAGGLESLVQRLQVQASNIVGRVLLPSQHSSTPPALLVLTLEQLSYAGAEPEASSLTSAPRSTRSVDFRGLALGAKVDAGAGGAAEPLLAGADGEGCGGTMSVTLGLGQGCGTPYPTASLGLTLGGLAADLNPGGLATLDRLATVLRGMLGAGGQAPGTKGAGPEPCREQHDPPGAWASRSLLESLMLPDCEDLVLEAFAGAESELEVPPDEEVSDPDFWDARSQTASFCSTSSRFQSVYSSDSRAGSVWSSAGASMQTAATPALAAPEKTLSRLHDLTASIREVAAPLQWSLSAKLPRVQATLPYPGTDDGLVLSFEHVSLQLRGQAPCILAGLTLHTLELVEERSAAVDVAEDQHMTACCSLPSSVGPCPDYARPGPYDPDESPLKSTLEQLSDLHIPDRAGTEARPSSTAAYPFLFCSGSDAQGLSRSGAAADERAALTLFCQSGGSGTGWDTHVHLAPLSCWLNLPAAERLLAAVERLAVGMRDCAPAPEVAGCGVAVSPSTLSPAVSSQSLGTDRQSSVSLPELEPSLSIHCSQLCLLVPLPLSACASGLDGSSVWPGPGSCLALITSLGCGDPLVHAQAMQGVREVDSADCKPELAALHASSALTLVVRRAPPARLSQVFTSLQLAGARVLWLPAGSHKGALLEASPQDGGGAIQVFCRSSFGATPLSSPDRLEALWEQATPAPTSASDEGCGVWRSSEPEALLTSLEASTRQECTHALRASGLHVHLDLDPARLAPLAPLLEACLGLLPAPTLPGVELATQNCLSLDAAARLTLRDAADRPLFHAEVAGFHAFFVAGLGRVPGASAAVLTLDGADLACAQTGDLLLHGGGPGASGPTLALLHLSRQVDGTVINQGRRVVYPCRSIGLLQIRECTLSTSDGDPTLGWLAQVGALLAPAPSASSPDPPLAPGPRALWTVRCESVAVRYEAPRGAPAPTAAAVLRAGSAVWRGPGAGDAAARHSLVLGCLDLHVAPAQTREAARWARGAPVDGWRADLAGQGYLLVASEAEVEVLLPADTGEGGVRVSNQLLALALTPRGGQLVQRLGHQLAGAVGPGRGASPRPEGAEQELAAARDVLAGVDEDAFREARGARARGGAAGPAASVFVEGGFYQDIPLEPLSPAGSPPVMVDSDTAWQELEGPSSSDNQDGTWFGATRLVDDYVIPPSFVPSPLQLEADPEDLRLHCTLNIDITLTASTGDVVVTRLRDMCIMVEGESSAARDGPDAAASSPATTCTLRSLTVEDSRGRPVLSRHGPPTPSRTEPPPQLSVVVHSVRVGGEVEYRVAAAVAPLRLQLRKRSIDVLRDVLAQGAEGADFDEDFGARLVDWSGWEDGEAEAGESKAGGTADSTASWPFIQHFTLKPMLIVLDHAASAVNLQALREGSLNELLHLVPLGGVRLTYRELRLVGVDGLAALGSAILNAYIRETAYQAHKFVGGTRPIRPLVRVAGAAGAAVTGPFCGLSRPKRRGFARDLSRGIRGLATAILDEALGAAGAAAGTAAGRLDGQAGVAAGALQRTLKGARRKLDAQPRN